MSLRPAPPLPTDAEKWKRLMNHMYGCEEDRLFVWLRGVRRVVEDTEREKAGRERAA